MKILVNPTLPYLPFWQLVRHLGNTNFAGKSASMQNFPALFMLPEENVYEDCGRSQTIYDRGIVHAYFVMGNMSDRAFKQQ